MTFQPLIALVSGLASGVLLLAAVAGGIAGVLFTLTLTPLPLAIAGLGWGWLTALGAGVVAAILVAALTVPSGALVHLFLFGLPIAAFSYLTMLHRDAVAPNGQTYREWYPVGRVATAIALWSGGVAAVTIPTLGSDLASIQTELRATIDRFFELQRDSIPDDVAAQMTPERRDQLAEIMLWSLPAATASLLTLICMLNMWLGAKIVDRSGRSTRPWPDLTMLALPRFAPLVFVGAAVISFIEGLVGLMATAFVWAFVVLYATIGLAILHQLTRGMPARFLLLAIVYLAVIFFLPTWLLLAVIGMAEPFSPLRRRTTEATVGPRPPGSGSPPAPT